MSNQSVQPAKRRSSNLELYRVVLMLLIIAHHYVVNSGVLERVYEAPMAANSLFLLLFGAWGKPGINCFVLITGYFMCKSQITLKKFLKLVFEVYLYKILTYAVFVLCGYEALSLKGVVRLITPITAISTNFTSCYILFYLFIPFLNILLRSLKEKQHILLIAACLTVYTLFGGLNGLFFSMDMNYISWFIVLYFIGAYFRLYPRKLFDNTKFWGWATVSCILMACCSVVACAWLQHRLGKTKLEYFFVADCNKPLALALGVSSFLFFKNLKLPYSRLINCLGASIFGVLQIHTNSHTLRTWLWKDFLNSAAMYDSKWLVGHAIACVLGIFLVCTAIDILRIRLLEEPAFRLYDRHWERLLQKYRNAEQAVCKRLGIPQD